MSLSTNTTYRVYVDKLGASNPSEFIGDAGELFYDPNIPTLKLSDGSTPGGITISGGGGGETQNYSLTFVGIGSTIVDSGDFTVETYGNAGLTSETRKIVINSTDADGNLIYPPSFSYIKFENEASTSSLTIAPKVIQDVRMDYRGFSAGINQLYGDDPHVNQLIIHKTDNIVYYYSNGEANFEDFTALSLDNSDIVASVVFYTKDFDETGGGKETSMRTFNDFFRSFVDNVLYTNSGIGTIGDISTNFDNNIGILTSVLPPLYSPFRFYSDHQILQFPYPFDGPNVSGSGGEIAVSITSASTISVYPMGDLLGSGYQVGDFIVIPGDEFTNGSTPDNDVTVTVTSVGPSGELESDGLSASSPTPPLLYPTDSISDGGDDIYDGGNKIVTDLYPLERNYNVSTGIPYNDGLISVGTSYFGGGNYVTKYANSVFAMVSVGSSIKTLGFAGNWGADGRPQPERSQPLYDTTKYTITDFEVIESSGSWNNENYNVTIDFSKQESITVDSFNNFYTPISRNPRITKGDNEEIANNILIGENAGEFLGANSEGNILLGRNAGRGTPGAILSLSVTSSTTLAGEANNTYDMYPKGGSGRLARIKLKRDENGDISFVGFYANPSDIFRSIGRGFGYRNGEVLTVDGSSVGGATGVDDVTLTVSDETGSTYHMDNNVFIGNGAGKLGRGEYSVFIGEAAGSQSTSPHSIFIGSYTGGFSTGGNNNFLGNSAGYYNSTGCHNNFLGNSAGRNNSTGYNNNFLGYSAGRNNTGGSNNNFLGYEAGFYNTTGYGNNFFGDNAGNKNTTGDGNNFVNAYAGYNNTTGGYNNFFGYGAGRSNTTGCHNIFLGSYTGISTSASNKIVLGHGSAYDQIFDSPDTTKGTQLAIGVRTDSNPSKYWIVGNENFNVGIGTTNPTSKLTVGGDVKVGFNTSQGVILTSPNGTQYRLIVDDSGTLSTSTV